MEYYNINRHGKQRKIANKRLEAFVDSRIDDATEPLVPILGHHISRIERLEKCLAVLSAINLVLLVWLLMAIL